jgi:hypothetical protein
MVLVVPVTLSPPRRQAPTSTKTRFNAVDALLLLLNRKK